MKVYEDEVSAREAVARSLRTYLKKVLIDWAKQIKPEEQQKSIQKNAVSQPVEPLDKKFVQPILPEYFNDEAKKIVKTCFENEVDQFQSLHTFHRFFNNTLKRFNKDKEVWPDSFYERFAESCLAELYEKGHELLYQGSSILVFYKEGQFVRALKPELNSKGLNAKSNKNIRIIGSENQFKDKDGVISSLKKFKDLLFNSNKLRAPRLIDIEENKVVWGDREGVLVVYEKRKGSCVGPNIYAALDELIQETKKINDNTVSNVSPKINLGSAIYKLQEVVNKTPDLLSCHFYLIDEEQDTVINYTAKRNTCDPIDNALLASEEMTELLVETKVSTNYHFKEFIVGLFKNSFFSFSCALSLFVVAAITLICSIFLPVPMLYLWSSLAFVAGLIVLGYSSYKMMNKLIKETKPTKEFWEITLTKLNSSDFPDLLSKKLSSLSNHILSNNKQNKKLSDNKKQLLCNSQTKEEEKFELSDNINNLSKPSDLDRSNPFRVSVQNDLFDENKENSSHQENQNKKIKEKFKKNTGIKFIKKSLQVIKKKTIRKGKKQARSSNKNSSGQVYSEPNFKQKIIKTMGAGLNPFDEECGLKPSIEQNVIEKVTLSTVNPFDEQPNLTSIIKPKKIVQSYKNLVNKSPDKNNHFKAEEKELSFKKNKGFSIFNFFKKKTNKENNVSDLPVERSPAKAAVYSGG